MTVLALQETSRTDCFQDLYVVVTKPRRAPPAQLVSVAVALKRYLMTPGPTPVPPQVLSAMAQPIVHHRAPDFQAVLQRCLGRMREVFRTREEVLLFTASGTGGMESAAANLCSPSERVLVVSSGYFGERWRQIAASFGAEVN